MPHRNSWGLLDDCTMDLTVPGLLGSLERIVSSCSFPRHSLDRLARQTNKGTMFRVQDTINRKSRDSRKSISVVLVSAFFLAVLRLQSHRLKIPQSPSLIVADATGKMTGLGIILLSQQVH